MLIQFAYPFKIPRYINVDLQRFFNFCFNVFLPTGLHGVFSDLSVSELHYDFSVNLFSLA